MSSYLRLLNTFCIAVICSCFSWVAGARSGYPELCNQSYIKRHQLLDSLADPRATKLGANAYLQRIDLILQNARSMHDRGLELAALHYKCDYEDGHHLITPDEKIKQLSAILEGIDREKYPEYAAIYRYDLGSNFFGKKRDYVRAFEYYVQVIQLLGSLSSADFPDKKTMIVYIANQYYKLGAYDQSKNLLHDADTIKNYWPKDRFVLYNAKNTLGLIFRTNGELDSAIHFFQVAYRLALQQRDSTWMAITSGNIGICHYMSANYAAAIPLLRNDIKYSFLCPGQDAIDNGMKSLLILADIHLKTDSIRSFENDIALAYQYIDSCRDKVRPYSMLYPVLARYFFRQGRFKESASAYDSAAVYKDSLARRDNIYQLARLEHLQEVERHEAELQKINAEKRLTVVTRNGLIAGIVLLAVITLLIVSRQRIRHKIKNEELRARNEQAKKALMDASEKLENYTLHLQEKNELIEQAGREIQRLHSERNNQAYDQPHNDVLQKLYSSTILTDEEWNDFKALFEQVHKGYLQWLKDKIPDLTPSDTRFLVLHKLKLSNKDMAGILGVQTDSIRSYKHRLKKRIDLTGDTELKNLIGELLENRPELRS